jgi:hypothetical protein
MTLMIHNKQHFATKCHAILMEEETLFYLRGHAIVMAYQNLQTIWPEGQRNMTLKQLLYALRRNIW